MSQRQRGMRDCRSRVRVAAAAVGLGLFAPSVHATPSIAPAYQSNYSLINLGPVQDLPIFYGGLTFLRGSTDTLLVGGNANEASGALYTVSVTRDAGNHIVGLGAATLFSDAAYIDGGLEYASNGALLYTGFPTNTLGELAPNSTTTNKTVDLSAAGISGSVGALGTVPVGQPGAGEFKVVSYNTGDWYTVTLAPDGSGTFDVTGVTLETTLGQIGVGGPGPEGFIYVPNGSPLFPSPTLLMSEYYTGFVGAYDVDADGNPLGGTRRDFITGLVGAEGALIDPMTGDFLFSTFGDDNQIYEVRGFVPPPPVPEPDASLLLGAGLVVLVAWSRMRLPS